MADPFFPLPFENIPSRAKFRQIHCGQPFAAGPLAVEAFPLHHPQGALEFRLEAEGRVLVHASDHEHGDPEIDAGLLDAALLVMDAQYTPEEYAGKAGWGHSSYAHAAQAAEQAAVQRLALFHHDPAHDDTFLDTMLMEANRLFRSVEMAREAGEIEI